MPHVLSRYPNPRPLGHSVEETLEAAEVSVRIIPLVFEKTNIDGDRF